MSFFFNKARAQPVKRGSTPVKPAQAGKAGKETLNRLGCRACPLDKAENLTPKMPADLGETPTHVYFLGEGPTKADDKKGEPFSDKAGSLLKGLVSDLDDGDTVGDLADYSFDNVVRDYVGESKEPTWVAMECCRSRIIKSIEKAKPRLIVGLGILPLQWMLNSSDMIGLRGRTFAVQIGNHACWFIPTYSPQFIIENAYDEAKPLQSKLGHCLKFDVARAIKLADTLPKPVIDTPQGARAGVQAFNGHGKGQLAEVLTLISEARKAPEKAIDIETSHLRPYAAGAKVLTAALSFRNVNFAFAIDHPKAGWKLNEKEQIKAALKMLLRDPVKIIAHNAPFEVEWLIALLGKSAIRHEVWECTMMQSHFLDERRGKRGGNDEQFQPNPYQALDFLVKQHFGISYKGLFKLDRKNMAAADLDETLLYNGADTKYTLRLYKNHIARLEQAGLLAAYNEARLRQPTVSLMSSLGIDVDQKHNKKLGDQLSKEIAEVEIRIKTVPEVQAFIKDRRAFNPASQPDVIKIFKDYLKVGKQLLNSDGKETVDKATLLKIKHPLAKDIEVFRNKSKLKSTYIDPFVVGKGVFIWPDRKIHPSFNTTFAETGRTSSDEPNQQNWPSRNDKWVRKQLVAPDGHLLVAFDFGQLEGCTGAMCSKDKVFIKALWEDYDMHMEWAQRTAKAWPEYIGGSENYTDKAVMKKFRSLIKNKLVFPAFFGAQPESIRGYLTEALEIEAPKKVIEKLFNDFWGEFSGHKQWQKRLITNYYETGYVESPTGRRRHYPLSGPQAINYPIQSVACDIVCAAMCSLSQRASSTGNWYLHPTMNIHDDLTFVIPDNNKVLEEAIETIYRTMLSPPYDFINVPLSVSCSMGKNWLEMEEIDKFWSHKHL